jgi:plastocyanin
MRQRRTLLPFCFATLCLAASSAWAADVTVNIGGNTFSPENVTIQVGDTVTWVNEGQGFHNVVSDSAGFRSGDADLNWTFSHQFNSAGVFGYYCEPHQAFGMIGTVTVQEGNGGGGDNPGTLRFSLASYTVSEGAGTATITVNRVDGDDGPASVQWAATAGTATAGADFTAASGTLSWADGNDTNKTFQITIINDTADETNETINLALSNATGAALDNARRTATVTITDNDGGGGGNAPAAPANLRADAQSTTEIRLDWTDAANNETGFRIERRTLTGSFQEVGTVGANTTSFVAGGLSADTFYVFRVQAQNNAGNSAFSNEAGAAPNTNALPCLASATALCVNNNRFQIEVQWRTPDGSSPQNGQGQAVPIPSAPDSGLFYFFSSSNLEMLVKVLNACGLNNRYWVFFAATTNVEFGVTVTDTQSGRVKSYFNPQGRPAPPIQDTDAFATCP